MPGRILVDRVSKVYALGESQRSLRAALLAMGRRLFSSHSTSTKRQHWALRDISFEVNPGEALGLIGPNGSGKTTILKLLSKITYPTSGVYQVEGRLSSLIELGAGFHPDLTGRENIFLNATILGLTRRDIVRKLDQIIDFSGIALFIDTPVKRYSSGMYVRLGFAIAAHVEPDVLLVDEVLAVGDGMFRQRCAKRIKELRQSGTTIVFISHNMPLVSSVCDRAIFLANGRIRAQGDVVEVINAYEKSIYTEQTLPATNGAQGRLRVEDSSSLRITHVEVGRAQRQEETDELSYAEPAEVVVHFEASVPIHQPNLVLRIVRSDGMTCAMIRTADYGYELEALSGIGTISVWLAPLQLSGGVYMFDARLLGEVDGMPLAFGRSSWFQVTGLSFGHGESGGVYVPRVSDVRMVRESWQESLSEIDQQQESIA